eukprot:Skav217722  [mRNA]  locus=scaffold308:54725:63844:- [translate_table: standard]
MERRRREIKESTPVNVGFDWDHHVEMAASTSPRGRHYIESWFLAPGRAPICLRSRRLLVTADATCEDFKSQCLALWEDLVVAGDDIHIVQVEPKPDTLMRTSVHILIIQGAAWNNRGILLRCEQFPVLAKHRALLLTIGDSVLQVFRTAQVETMCRNHWRPCFLEGAGLQRQYLADEQPPLQDGMLLHGNIMIADDETPDPSDTEEDDDDIDYDDSLDTEAPGTDDEVFTEGDPGSEESEVNTTGDSRSGALTNLDWAEIPWTYIMEDILGSRHSWATPRQEDEDVVTFMQRSRSRSRGASAADADQSHPEPAHDEAGESEGNASEDPTLIDWHVLYTDMPTNPSTVQAGPHGPNPAQVAGAIGFPLHEIVNLYIVHSLAAIDVEHVVLTECAGDHLHRDTEVMILLDVRCAGEEGNNDEVLHSQMVCRNRANLVSFMGFLQLSRIARLYASNIHVRHNGQPWTLDDPTVYALRNGDHIEITFDKPAQEEYRRHLVDWLYDEGVTPVAHLLTPLTNTTAISPTLPFALDLSDFAGAPATCSGGDQALRTQPLIFNSWYISHTQYTTCRDSRVVAFSAHSPTWKNTISRVWRDVFDVHRPYTVTIVQPQPVQLGRPEFDLFPHIVIEQHRSDDQIAAVITVQHKKFHGAVEFLAQAAYSLPALVGRQGLLQTAQVWRYGIEPEDRYHVLYDNEEVFDVRGLRRPTGQSFTIIVEELEDQEAEDQAALLQARDRRSGSVIAHPAEPSRGETAHDRPDHALCPTTGEAETPDLTAQEEQALEDLWKMAEAGTMQRGPDEPPFRALVATYYISPARLPACPFPRYQWLGPNPITWKRDLIQPWNEFLQPDDPTEIILVRPYPMQSDGTNTVMAYILIVQHAEFGACPVLTTLGEDNEYLHIARFVPRQATHRNVLLAAGLHHRCLTPMHTAWCSATVGPEAILYDPPTVLSDGANILINIIEIAGSLETPEHQIDQTTPTPFDECLRGDAVAHAHRPSEEGSTAIDFGAVIDNFDWFDSHFTLLRYDLLDLADHAWKPCSKPWLALPWLDQADTVWEIEVYMDGSSRKDQDHLGAGVILFALTSRGWTLAGATSLSRTTSKKLAYEAETLAAILALKAGHDTLKIVIASQGWAPRLRLCYDNLTVGQQTAGKWQSYSQPNMIHLLRSMARLIEVRYHIKIHFQHVPAHMGHPGNEAADTLAEAAAHGHPLDDWQHFIDTTTHGEFVSRAEWFWFLFYQPQGGYWQGHTFCWPQMHQTHKLSKQPSLRPGKVCATLAAEGQNPNYVQRSLEDHEAILHRLQLPEHLIRAFATAQGLAVHKRHKHQIFSLEHDLVQGHTCPSCFRCFWSTQRLQQHLSYISRKTGQNRCYQALRQQGYQAEYSATGIEQAWKGASRLEAIQLPGPLIPPEVHRQHRRADLQRHLDDVEAQLQPLPDGMDAPDPTDLHHSLAQATLAWFQLFVHRGGTTGEVPDLEELWLGVLTDLPAELHQWGEMEFLAWSRHGLQGLSDDLIDGEAEQVIDQAVASLLADLPSADLREQAERLRRQLRELDGLGQEPVPHRPIKWAASTTRNGPPAGSDVPAGFLHQDEWLQALRQVRFDALPPDRALPVILWNGRPTIVVAHLFSGRRRAGDFHYWLQQWAQGESFRLLILSMDTAVHDEHGNLSHFAASWRRLLQCYEAGLLGLSLCGPPCETFSEARYNELEPTEGTRDNRGPRPLRTREHLVGLPHLSLRELKQTRQGTAFMIQMQHVLALHICHGGYYMEEHPAPPQQEERASLWTAPVTELLRGHPDVHLHVVNQWKFDAPNIKPTGVLALRLPKFPFSLWRRQNPDAMKPAQGAIGRNASGHFRTACLKEYPGRFSKALASVVWDQLQSDYAAGKYRLVRAPPEELMAWLEQVAQQSAQHQEPTAMRADYQDQFAQ